MRRSEMRRKFDEIVAFAEVEKFIDTPVTHYSSGMYLRLAFAVAAHLEPEISLVYEVLAVGDAIFQRKCRIKCRRWGRGGRTVLLYPTTCRHHAPLPAHYFTGRGKSVGDGPSTQVVRRLLSLGLGTTARGFWPELSTAPGNDIVRLARRARLSEAVGLQNRWIFVCRFSSRSNMKSHGGHVLVPNLHFYNDEGVYAFVTGDLDPEWRHRQRPAGRYVSTAMIPGNLLSEGTLFVGAAISTIDPVVVAFFVRDPPLLCKW